MASGKDTATASQSESSIMEPGTSAALAAVTSQPHDRAVEEAVRESEWRLRGIVEQSLDGIALTDENGLIIEWNPAQERIYGLPREQAIGRSLWDLQYEAAPAGLKTAAAYDQMKAMVLEFLRTGEAPWLNVLMERQVRRGDGSERTVQWVTFATKTERGFRAGSVTRDVTERRETERQLQATSDTLEALLDSAPIGIVGLDAEGGVRSWNRASERIFGLSRDEVLGAPPPYAAPEAGEHALGTDARRPEAQQGQEIRHRRPDGTVVYLNLRSAPLLDADGRLDGYVTSITDVTARKRAEGRLVRSEARFHNVADSMQDGLFILEGSRAVYANDRAVEILGYSRGELLALPLDCIVASEERERVRQFLQEGSAAQGQLDFWVPRPDGQRRYLQCRYSRQTPAGPSRIGYVLITDATERRLAEDALRRSEELYRGIAEATLEGIWVLGPDGDSVYANRRMADMLGLPVEALIGRNLLDFVAGPQPDAEASPLVWAEHMEGGPSECLLRRADGHPVWTLLSVAYLHGEGGRRAGALAAFTDITERKLAEEERLRLQEQVQRAQKLESLGVLAGGIAHDFNNLLVAILGNADLLLMDLPGDSPMRQLVEEIHSSSMRAADLSRQMLTYSGRGTMTPRRFDVNQVVRQVMRSLAGRAGRPEALQMHLAPGLPLLEGDPAQIEQVVANLANNALDALPEGEGTVTVSTGLIQADADYLAGLHLGEGLPAGDYVSIEVRDTGCGMDEDTLKRIFDPFFSTKFIGRGLGLPVVQGVVSAHRGAIEVGSAPGAGSTFRVLLPVSRDAATAPEAATPALPPGILVVDDEAGVRTVAKRVLESEGYTVLTASDGEEGIAVFREHADDVALVLVDLTMPRLAGEDACRELHSIRPDVPVVLLSGYSEQTASASFATLGIAGFIQKPFTATELCSRVGAAVRGGPPRRS
ncbi:MAG: hybrid sensor histidine kinase/response regulator [Anaerolineae bacterium]